MEKPYTFNLLHLLFLYLLLPFLSNSIPPPAQTDHSEIISRFQRYLQINTSQPSPDYQKSTHFILSQADSLSLQSQVIEFVQGKPIVLLQWPGSDPSLPSILLNSHTDVVPSEYSKWVHPPFGAHIDEQGNIFARGSQDMKCVGMQYLEAIRRLRFSGFCPKRSLYLSFVPDEEIDSRDGAEMLASSDVFKNMNVDIVLDEGLASPNENYRVFYGERAPWWLVIKSNGAPGHGAKLYENSAMENLFKSIESIRRFRASQFDLVKASLKAEGEVISVNMAVLKAGTSSPIYNNLHASDPIGTTNYRVFYGERAPWWLVIKSNGAPGHGAKLYENSAMENLFKSIESIRRFRASQFDLVKAGLKAEGEVISVNMAVLKAGTSSPTGFVMNLQPSEAEAGFDIRIPPIGDLESLEKQIAEEWAPASRNMTFEFKAKGILHDDLGRPLVTATDSSNPWWTLLEEAIKKANGKIGKPEIFPASTDAQNFRKLGLPAIGFSPMANTPILLHDHNEFLNQAEYLRGIEVYESIIKAYTSYIPPGGHGDSRDEL